jgi:hypothetical protein
MSVASRRSLIRLGYCSPHPTIASVGRVHRVTDNRGLKMARWRSDFGLPRSRTLRFWPDWLTPLGRWERAITRVAAKVRSSILTAP